METIKQAIIEKKQLHHACINAGKLVAMRKDPELYNSVVSSNLVNADGMAVVWASKILSKYPVPERVTGIDLMERIVEMAQKEHYKIFFFGASQEMLKKTIDHYSKKYSKDIIAGYRNGYFMPEDEINIAKSIANSGAQILFVGIKTPIKENFLFRNKDILKEVNLIMGVGGSFDVIGGKVLRAPLWAQNNGIEWLYRLMQEPRKLWKRYLIGNFIFINMVFFGLIKNLARFLFKKH